MKTFKWMTVLLFAGMLTAGLTAKAEEKTKEYHESWAASSVANLEISNRFGEVKIKNDGGSDVTIDVVITVEGANEERINQMLDKIEVTFRKNGNTVVAETKIQSDFKSQRRFSIDYDVNIPSDKNLKIENKYGNTLVNRLEANGEFDIKYGNISANELMTPEGGKLTLNLAYGNANIGAASNLEAFVAYSPVSIDELKSLKLDSKYSNFEIEEVKSMVIVSKYDKFSIDEAVAIEGTTKYSNLKVGELAESLKIESGYGGIRVEEVKKGFEFINITNSYGQIALGLNDAAYNIDASCDYCGISYPEEDFSGNRTHENNTYTLEGKVGSDGGGKVYIRSRYGEIKLD